jgi:hypothetical protein
MNRTDETAHKSDSTRQNVSPAPYNPFNSFNTFLGAARTYGMTCGRVLSHRLSSAPQRLAVIVGA